MKKRIITSFRLFESRLFETTPPFTVIGGSAWRKLMGEEKPDEMSKARLEELLKKAQADQDGDMVEELEELIADIQISDFNPDDYDVLVPAEEDGGGGGGGGTPPGMDPPPQNEKPWPPKGSNPQNPPPPGDTPTGPPKNDPGDQPGDKPGDKPEGKTPIPPNIIGKKARITHGPYAGQIGTIAGINSDGTIRINPD